MSRRQVQNVIKMIKNVKIVKFHDHIWNHHENCIRISTNMPGIGLVIQEIGFDDFSQFGENEHYFLLVNAMAACLVVSRHFMNIVLQPRN